MHASWCGLARTVCMYINTLLGRSIVSCGRPTRKVRTLHLLPIAASTARSLVTITFTVFLPSDQLCSLKGSCMDIVVWITSCSVLAVSAMTDRTNSRPEFRVAPEPTCRPENTTGRRTLCASITAEDVCWGNAVMSQRHFLGRASRSCSKSYPSFPRKCSCLRLRCRCGCPRYARRGVLHGPCRVVRYRVSLSQSPRCHPTVRKRLNTLSLPSHGVTKPLIFLTVLNTSQLHRCSGLRRLGVLGGAVLPGLNGSISSLPVIDRNQVLAVSMQ